MPKKFFWIVYTAIRRANFNLTRMPEIVYKKGKRLNKNQYHLLVQSQTRR